jgi:hypothetical protein
MSITRSESENQFQTHEYTSDFIMPLDLDGTSTLAELMLSAAVSQQLKANSANYVVPRSKIIRLLGQENVIVLYNRCRSGYSKRMPSQECC